ncbi:MAG: DNA adenine methylase [Candidatus Thorarchaeota archaeon]
MRVVLTARPIVKWAGGKGQLLEKLWDNCPPRFNSYYEPFVGGGALFFHLRERGVLGRTILADANKELIALYIAVRDRIEEIIRELSSGRYVYDEKVYYEIRDWEPTEPVQRAARFIYLNRTCYNGLYRVNAEGKFNVPFGRYRNPRILDERNLRAASKAFQDVEFRIGDFEETVWDASAGDFIYFDPPYAPLSKTADFTAYTEAGFSFDEQKRLARVFRELDERGCYVLESNSATEEIRELYEGYRIVEVRAKRAISSDAKTRGPVTELLIRNYEARKADVQTSLDEF